MRPNSALVVLATCAVFACGAKQQPNAGANNELGWLIPVTATGGARVNAIALGQSGELVIGGDFAGSIQIGESTATSSGGRDGFVARLDAKSGRISWLRLLGSSGDDKVRSIAVAGDGSIAFAGEIGGRVEIASSELVAAGQPDGVIGTISAAGDYEWAAAIGGTRYASLAAVAFTASGELVTTGYFAGELGLLGRPIYSGGGADVLVARFRRSGGVVWAVRGGGPGADLGRAIVALPDGSLAIAGSVMDGAEFGGLPIALDAPASDLLAAKLDAGGRFVWASASGGEQNDSGSVIVRAGEELIAAGRSVPALVRAKGDGTLESATPLPDIATVTALSYGAQLFVARTVANPSGVGSGVAITAGLLSGNTTTKNLVATDSVSVLSMASGESALFIGGSFRGELRAGSSALEGAADQTAGFVGSWNWR